MTWVKLLINWDSMMDNENLYVDQVRQVRYYQWIYDRDVKGSVPYAKIKMALEQHQAKANIGNIFQI